MTPKPHKTPIIVVAQVTAFHDRRCPIVSSPMWLRLKS